MLVVESIAVVVVVVVAVVDNQRGEIDLCLTFIKTFFGGEDFRKKRIFKSVSCQPLMYLGKTPIK